MVKGRSLYFLYALALLLLILYSFRVIPSFITKHFEDGVALLDLRLWYTSSEVYNLFYALGNSGRESYVYFLLYVDMFYPIVYGLFLILTIHILYKRVNFKETNLKIAMALPLGALLFDYIENISILFLLNNYPAIEGCNVLVASASTFLKWMLLLICVATILSTLFVLVYRRYQKLLIK